MCRKEDLDPIYPLKRDMFVLMAWTMQWYPLRYTVVAAILMVPRLAVWEASSREEQKKWGSSFSKRCKVGMNWKLHSLSMTKAFFPRSCWGSIQSHMIARSRLLKETPCSSLFLLNNLKAKQSDAVGYDQGFPLLKHSIRKNSCTSTCLIHSFIKFEINKKVYSHPHN